LEKVGMGLASHLRGIAVPLALILYGVMIIALQPFIIMALAPDHESSPAEWQLAAVIIYLVINAALLYSWYYVTLKVRNMLQERRR